MRKILACLIMTLFWSWGLARAKETQWYKGNTHCHTLHSDGDEYPRRVVRWYRDHEYHFLAISEHNKITKTKFLDTDPHDDFILIQAEEVTDSFQGIPVHLNALGVGSLIQPQHGDSVAATLQNNVDAIRKAGAVPQINHPNWKWSFTDTEMAGLKHVSLFELYNVNRTSNNFGAGGRPGMEEIWDRILSRGVLMYGVASDDAHDYLGERRPDRAVPGTGWIMVRAAKLTPKAILDALEKGDFYATVGVTLKDIRITKTQYAVTIEPYSDLAYTTSFIGEKGKVLQEVHGPEAAYTFTGEELYIRARIQASSGQFACTQPVFIARR